MSLLILNEIASSDEVFNKATAEALKLNAKSLASIYEIYWENAEQEIAEIDQVLSAGDTERLRKLAHSLKGSSRTLGADKLGSLAELIELSVKKGQDIQASQLVEILKENLQSFKSAVQKSNLLATK